jgi:flagellar protein FliO/FliZ
MIKLIPLSRATFPVALLAFGLAVLASGCPAQAFTPSGAKDGGENVPLHLSSTPTGNSHVSTGGASIVRTIVGLLIVIAVIWGLTWILRQVKSGRDTQADGSGLASMATLPLGSGRALHLVRAGSDYLLVGSAEQGVVPIYRYTEQQAHEAGLLDRGESQGPSGPMNARPERPGGDIASGLLERLRGWTVRQ